MSSDPRWVMISSEAAAVSFSAPFLQLDRESTRVVVKSSERPKDGIFIACAFRLKDRKKKSKNWSIANRFNFWLNLTCFH